MCNKTDSYDSSLSFSWIYTLSSPPIFPQQFFHFLGSQIPLVILEGRIIIDLLGQNHAFSYLYLSYDTLVHTLKAWNKDNLKKFSFSFSHILFPTNDKDVISRIIELFNLLSCWVLCELHLERQSTKGDNREGREEKWRSMDE